MRNRPLVPARSIRSVKWEILYNNWWRMLVASDRQNDPKAGRLARGFLYLERGTLGRGAAGRANTESHGTIMIMTQLLRL